MLKINGYITECYDENAFNEIFLDFIEGHGWSFMGTVTEEELHYPECYSEYKCKSGICNNCKINKECIIKQKRSLADEWVKWYESIDGDCGCNCLDCKYNTVCDESIEDIEL